MYYSFCWRTVTCVDRADVCADRRVLMLIVPIVWAIASANGNHAWLARAARASPSRSAPLAGAGGMDELPSPRRPILTLARATIATDAVSPCPGGDIRVGISRAGRGGRARTYVNLSVFPPSPGNSVRALVGDRHSSRRTAGADGHQHRPQSDGLPGIAQLRTIVGVVMTVGSTSVLALIISAIVWGLRQPQPPPRGRKIGVLVSAAPVIAGRGDTINFF